MKLFLFASSIVLFTTFASAQQHYVDSLHHQVNNAKDDTTKVLALFGLAEYYGFNQFDSSFFYARQTIELSEKLKYPYGGSLGLRGLFYAYNCQGNYPKALEVTLQNFKIAEKIKKERPLNFWVVIYMIGVLNREMENFPTAINQFYEAIRVNKEAGLPESNVWPAYIHMALVYQKLKKPDSALWFAQKGYDLSLQSIWRSRYNTFASAVLGEIHNELGNHELARKYYSLGVQQSKMVNNTFFLARNYNNLADLFNKTGYPDSSIYYARLSLQLCQEHKFSEYALYASTLLTKIYESQNKPDSTIKYLRIMLAAKDSVLGQSKVKEFQKYVFDDEQRKQEIQKAQEQYKNRIKTYALFSGMIILLLIAFILWRNNRQKQNAKVKIEKAYEELKSTQAQLIQSEKMASLGELTAGIAHEIQNPLNFVNNFSEVNKELIGELREEKDNSGTRDEILNNIENNLEKIIHHGKRADAIVKGMLQHSRASTGQKEPTDINALADEYLRLSYHGLRAKDRSFNATMKTDFDKTIGNINIIPQDIGRVLLNLYNNAFYVVTEKKKLQPDNYEPTVSVRTKIISPQPGGLRGAEIKVRDNGNGIPQKILDKIFQPFFTTKPTGQGTGLGLSLSYDIVKAHGGEIKVETKEGEGAEFIIQLPIV
ncbi:MAG: ATP-binding protein [Bacteroidota bacterium]|nr:ATP-binding protein [Bacteroidota bacterium]